MAETLAFADRQVAGGEGCATIVAVNPEKAMRARQDRSLLSLLRGASLLIPDGIGIVWAARTLNLGHFGRVPGSELMPNLCALAAEKGYSVFLYGARPEVNEAAVQTLTLRFPELKIAGCQHGYIDEDAIAGFGATHQSKRRGHGVCCVGQSGAGILDGAACAIVAGETMPRCRWNFRRAGGPGSAGAEGVLGAEPGMAVSPVA